MIIHKQFNSEEQLKDYVCDLIRGEEALEAFSFYEIADAFGCEIIHDDGEGVEVKVTSSYEYPMFITGVMEKIESYAVASEFIMLRTVALSDFIIDKCQHDDIIDPPKKVSWWKQLFQKPNIRVILSEDQSPSVFPKDFAGFISKNT